MGDLDQVDFHTTDQCSYMYRLYMGCIETCRRPVWLNRRSAKADTSEIFHLNGNETEDHAYMW